MFGRSKNAKPVQLALPGFDPVQPKPWSLAGCVDLNKRANFREYNSWATMIKRCYKTNFEGFCNYGGKGVKVCPEWRRSFAAFVRDMGRRPDGTTLDRIDPNGDYDPANCRWLDASENSRRSAVRPLAGFFSRRAAAGALGLSESGVRVRLYLGYCEEHAATLPKGSKRPADCPDCNAKGGA